MKKKKAKKRKRSVSAENESGSDIDSCFLSISKASLSEFQKLLPSSASFAAWILPPDSIASMCSVQRRLHLLEYRHLKHSSFNLLDYAASEGLSQFVEHILSCLDDIEIDPIGLGKKQYLLDSRCPLTGLTAVF